MTVQTTTNDRDLDTELVEVQKRLAEAAEALRGVELEARLAVLQSRVEILEKTPRGRFSIDPASVGWLVCLISLVSAEAWALLSAFAH